MAADFDHKSREASPAWVTRCLRDTGYLTAGEVTHVRQSPSRIGRTITSEFFELDLSYSQDSQGDCPEHCLSKVSFPQQFDFAQKEATFYSIMAEEPASGLLECYGTSVDVDLASTVILLEDKGSDFYQSEWPIPPDIDVCKRAIVSLAQVHARWWEHPDIDRRGLPRVDDVAVDNFMPLVASSVELFLADMGDRISESRKRTLNALLDWWPVRFKERIALGGDQTLLHGDAHFWNFLIPHDSATLPVLIDWQNWEIGFGPRDLAYTIGLHWFPERRQRYEEQLLDVYLEELHRHEINYSREQMHYDYRLFAALMLIMPVMQCVMKIPAGVWWPHVDRAFSAYEDLKCDDLV